jgi:integrase
MSVLFNHAIRYEWLEQGKNPTFRHSFSTMLMANGGNVKVGQELMRHANCRCTLEIYSQARLQAKREAQHRVVELIIPRERETTETELPLILDELDGTHK